MSLKMFIILRSSTFGQIGIFQIRRFRFSYSQPKRPGDHRL
jgi:hypothetical protein